MDSLNAILSDYRYISIPDDINRPVDADFLIVKDPCSDDILYASFLKEKALKLAEKEGVPSEEELLDSFKQQGLWTDKDSDILSEIEKEIDFVKSEIKKNARFIAKRKTLQKKLSDFEDLKASLNKKSESIKANSREYLAHEVYVFTLVQRCTLLPDKKPLWSNEESFYRDKSLYPNFIIFLAQSILRGIDISIAGIRKIARSSEWRIVWALQKENVLSLFNKKADELSTAQQLLIYWSRVYDSALEDIKDPVDAETMEDDEKFDEWFANREIRKQEESEQDDHRWKKSSHHQEQMVALNGYYVETCICGIGPQKGVPPAMKKRHDHSCLFGVWQEYSQEEKQKIADQFYARNSKGIRQHINREQERVADLRLIGEERLRDKKQRLVLKQPSKVVKR